MSTTTLNILAIALYFSVFISIGTAIILLYRGIVRKSFLCLSRALYPIAIVATCGLELDRVQFALTGINGTETFWMILVAIFMTIVAVVRSVFVLLEYMGKIKEDGNWH